MQIDWNLHAEIKKAIKDALSEWMREDGKEYFSSRIHSEEPTSNLMTIRQFCEKHVFLTQHALRAKILHADYNKFDGCISRVGRRILIKEKEALEFFRNPPKESNWKYPRR
jgi:hypothetical protein